MNLRFFNYVCKKIQVKMKNIFRIVAIAILALAMNSCQNEPDRSDFDAREEKLSEEIENINIKQTYRDIMMLYCDIIEDVYQKGKETGEYDIQRLKDFEKGLIADFEDKIKVEDMDLWSEIDDKYDESLIDRMETVGPMAEEIFGNNEQPQILEDGSVILRNDTIKELEDGRIKFNSDTITYEQFMQKIDYYEY